MRIIRGVMRVYEEQGVDVHRVVDGGFHLLGGKEERC